MKLIAELMKKDYTEKISEGIGKAILFPKEASCIRLEPGKTIELHHHENDHEMYAVLKGEVIILGDVYRKGEFHVCNCGESHNCRNSGVTEAILFTMKIDAE